MSSEESSTNDPRFACGQDFIATCYDVFLGRDLDTIDVAIERGCWKTHEALGSILKSEEFMDGILSCLVWEEPFPIHLFRDRLTIRHHIWAAETLPLSEAGRSAMWKATNWRAFLKVLVEDSDLMGAADLQPVTGIPDDTDMFEDVVREASPKQSHLIILGGPTRRD